MIAITPELEDLKSLYDVYLDIISTDATLYANKTKQLRLPIVPTEILKKLCTEAKKNFQNEKLVLELSAPISIIGDLHGHILDLFRILKTLGCPPSRNYLFLGDLVDRGEFSTETCTLVFLLKVLFPNNVYIIRGNHEFREITQNAGWDKEIYNLYNDDSVFDFFIDAFEYMPLAAIIDEFMICVHGGVGQNFHTLFQICDIPRPIKNFENKALTDLLWSDPDEKVEEYGSSFRGLGNTFGSAPAKRFLEDTQVKFLVRGHQCINNGVELSHNGRVITVFSASSYCGTMENKSGVLNVIDSCRYDVLRLPPIGYMKRFDSNLTGFEICKVTLEKCREKSLQRTRSRRVSVDDTRELSSKKLTKFKSAVDMPRVPFSFSPQLKKQFEMRSRGKLI